MSTVLLYVPGSRPDRFEKAVATGAGVILDLEDSVADEDKPAARAAVARWLATTTYDGELQVRVNSTRTAEFWFDLASLPAQVDLRMPKVESPTDLEPVADRRVHAILESAAGVENALAIARHPSVVALSLGEADLGAELGMDGEEAFDWVRSRVVVASAAAGLPAPMMAAYPAIRDVEGLAESCRRGRRLGMRGRTAIHPSQVPVIRSVFAPSAQEVAWAERVLAALARSGVATLDDGSMVDAAMAKRARAILG